MTKEKTGLPNEGKCPCACHSHGDNMVGLRHYHKAPCDCYTCNLRFPYGMPHFTTMLGG